MPDINSLHPMQNEEINAQQITQNDNSIAPVQISQSEDINMGCANQCQLNINIDGGSVDFSHDTVTPATLAEGITAHNRLGQPIVGTAQSGHGGLPEGGLPGDILTKSSEADYAVEWVTPANSVEQDNTRPITAAAVYTEVGNINVLLSLI